MKFPFKTYFLSVAFICISFNSFSQNRNLEYYLNEGIRNSPLLKDLTNQMNSASLDSLIIRAQKKPQIEWRSQLLYSPYNDNIGYDDVITDGGNYQAVGYVSQNIFNTKILANNFNSISNQKKSAGINKKLSTAELKKTITNLYLASYSLYSDLEFNGSFLDIMTDQNQIMTRLVQAGIYNQSDYLALLVETQGQEILVNQLKNQYEKEIRLMNEACGIVDTTHIILQIPDIKLADLVSPDDYLVLKLYSLDSLQIINEKTALDLKYKPKVNWFGDAGFLTSKPWNFYRHFGASAGISLNVPIFDGKQRQIENQKLSIREDTRSFYRINSRNQNSQQFLRLKGEMEGLKETRTKLEKQLSVSDMLVKSLKSQLETGIVRIADYLNAIKGYRNINHNINITDIDLLDIINEMNYILAK